MKPILVPLNLYADCENILTYAESIALKSGTKLVFFHPGSRKILPKLNTELRLGKDELPSVFDSIKPLHVQTYLRQFWEQFADHDIDFEFVFSPSSSLQGIIQEVETNSYQFVMTGTYAAPGIRNFFRGSLASRIIGSVNMPVFVIPASGCFYDIRNITYAVDLTAYDPNVIRQIKTIASTFDAKLTIAHVNSEQEESTEKETYLKTLEQTISDTIDYPKIYYKFFDHADPFAGIKKFVNLNNSHMLAMTNRKKFSWREFFGDKSLTRKMAREISVPILAFQKF
ncbi:MAG: hypothetical protein AAF587_18905 [Bacteroidota bacterium]